MAPTSPEDNSTSPRLRTIPDPHCVQNCVYKADIGSQSKVIEGTIL